MNNSANTLSRGKSLCAVFVLTWISLLLLTSGCAAVKPVEVPGLIESSNFRNWQPSLAILPYARFHGDKCTVHNIRNCSYSSEQDYIVDHYEKEFALDGLNSVDFIVVPFQQNPYLAHTMISFGFDDGDYLGVSAEVRLEEGESYSPVLGLMRNYELMYVVADERDLIRLRTRHRKADVHIYRTKANREQARQLFVDVMTRVNGLAISPEFYDTLTNNCTTNIVNHINKLKPNRVPIALPVILPGLSDRYAYDLGLLDTDLSFEETKRRARVNQLAEIYHDSPDFSIRIRR